MKKSKTGLKKRSRPVFNKSELVLSIRLLAATLKNGHDLLSGINYLKDTMSDPLSSEYKLITQQHLLGVNSVDLWVDFANRNKIPAIHQLVQVLLMGMHFGAPVSHLLDQLAQDILENKISLKKDQ
jgi:Flp pilus assembly protein TadB